VGLCHYDVFPDLPIHWKKEHQRCFDGEIIEKGVEPFPRKDGSMDWVQRKLCPWCHRSGEIGGLIMFTEVMTDKKRIEDQLRQSQKMEAIGTLAGGIAHDFNNLLMGIQGRVSLILMDLDPSHPHAEHIKAIEDSIRGGANLTSQLLGFARGGKYEEQPIDINALLLESATMFGRTKKEIQIHTKLLNQSPIVTVNRSQIEQVLLNLYINAWQAMPDGGNLYLETTIITLDDADCKPYQAKPGRYAKVSVTDTGIGMDEPIRKQVFNPFFTTKHKDRGTGLGLASAYGIIKNHAGIITVDSQVGQGTEFNIYLPIMGEKASTGKKINKEVPIATGLAKGSETILLVEDEELTMQVGQALLESLGYRVITAKNGKQAVDIIVKKGDGIDLVILDMIMPEMGGDKAFDLIREIQPAMPVILTSGYSLEGKASAIMRRGCNEFIPKPFTTSELSQKVRKVLDEATGPAKSPLS
jgi:nitrogen-specific signal transduction histidine kinase/ActR/RegA family two-component response regulator